MIYFTADTHFDHLNIIVKHHLRKFDNVIAMNDVIIDNINSIVGSNDILWHLGDFAWKVPIPFIKRIKCKNIHIVIGNHDKLSRFKDCQNVKIYTGFVDTTIFSQRVTLCHYPMRSWRASCHGAWHLHGHTHGNILDPIRNTLDVGIDNFGLKPVSWDEIVEYIKIKFPEIKETQ